MTCTIGPSEETDPRPRRYFPASMGILSKDSAVCCFFVADRASCDANRCQPRAARPADHGETDAGTAICKAHMLFRRTSSVCACAQCGHPQAGRRRASALCRLDARPGKAADPPGRSARRCPRPWQLWSGHAPGRAPGGFRPPARPAFGRQPRRDRASAKACRPARGGMSDLMADMALRAARAPRGAAGSGAS